MHDSNVKNFIYQPSKKYTTKELIDVVIKNFDEIISIFKDYYNESLDSQNIYTKFFISLDINDEIREYDLNSLIECKNDIQNSLISDFRIYVCSCAKSTSGNYLFSSLDMTLLKDYKIRVNYFDEFNHEVLKKYQEKIKNLLKDYCNFRFCMRKDEYIKTNQSDDYEKALSNYQSMFKADNEQFAQSEEFKEILNAIDKKIENLNKEGKIEMNEKKRTSIQYQLSNVFLFDYVFYDWYMLNQLLSFGPESMKKFLYDEWNRVKDILLKENRFIINDIEKNVTANDFDITVNKTSKGTIVYFFTFPDYEFTDAASKYVALALTFGKPRYFTLEYSYNHLTNTPCWVIGEFYIKDNKITHSNYGSVDNMRLSFFAGRVLDILDDFEAADKEKAIVNEQKNVSTNTDIADNQVNDNMKINKEDAIKIANDDRNLKDSVFKKWKEKDGIILGLIMFSSFDANLVKFKDNLAWHITAKGGRWGGTKNENGSVMHLDGAFVEPISCIVTCDTGQYYFSDDINADDIKAID